MPTPLTAGIPVSIDQARAQLRASGWVELLSGLRGDLANMRRFGEFKTTAAQIAVDARLDELDAALREVGEQVVYGPPRNSETAQEDLRNAAALLTLAAVDAQGQVVLSRAECEAILGRLERAYRKLEGPA